jgi:hypothetical protein
MPGSPPSPEGRRSAGAISRRELIRVGSLGLAGLSLDGLLRLQDASAASSPPRGRAKSAILLFLSGGPAHMDMWDLKPGAPEAIRGTFRPIDTKVAGIQVCEHLPRMARISDRYAILRSVHHAQDDHPAAAYWMMVGSPIDRPARDADMMSRADRPHPGSALAHVLGSTAGVPPFVMVPEAMQPNGPERAGQFAGFLGAAFDPYRINSDPNLPDYSPGEISAPVGLDAARIAARRRLLDVVADASVATLDRRPAACDAYLARAFDLLGSAAARRAFDIDAEPPETRDRYGRHVFGQSVLLARRMVEAGVRLVHVNWVRHDNGKGSQGYDTHSNHLELARRELLPATDAAFASLVEDLHLRGLLDETLVNMTGSSGACPGSTSTAAAITGPAASAWSWPAAASGGARSSALPTSSPPIPPPIPSPPKTSSPPSTTPSASTPVSRSSTGRIGRSISLTASLSSSSCEAVGTGRVTTAGPDCKGRVSGSLATARP